MPKKLTQDEFIKRAKKINGDKYDYSLVEYERNYSKVKIICKKHGVFEQIPKDHLRGFGCDKCSGSFNLKKEEFVEKSKYINGEKYDYSLVNYINNKIKIKIICKIHGVFLQKPNHHLSGVGCPYCGGTKKLTQEEFEKKSSSVHNCFYDYSKTLYVNNEKNVNIICKKHGQFSQKAENHLKGQGCPKCKLSKGEKKIYIFLVKNNINFKTQHSFLDCKFKSKLFFDFYLSEYNICVEFDGIQHYDSIEKFGGEKEFKKTKERDLAKNEFCIKNKIELIRIPYFEYKNIDLILNKAIKDGRVK